MGKQWRDCSIACWASESYTEMLAPVVHRKGMVEYTSVGENIVGRWRMSWGVGAWSTGSGEWL